MITKEDTVLELFPTPVLITKYPGTIEEEFKFIQNLKYESPQNNPIANFKTKDTYLLRHKELSKIKDFINKSLDNFTSELLNTKQKAIITQAWCNKNPPNTDHPVHYHSNSIVSGVFYFRQNPALQPIQFNKVDGQSSLTLKVEQYNNFNSDIVMFPMVDGELILFPSNLRHSVPPNSSKDTRYSMSFNTFANELGWVDDLTQVKLNIQEET